MNIKIKRFFVLNILYMRSYHIGYRSKWMELVIWVQKMDEAVCISFHTDALEKGMDTFALLTIAMGK